MIAPELIAEIRRIQLKARRLVSDVMAGEYASALCGRGMEFDEVREYTPGDDVRLIDWNVTARMGSPYVKVFREERELRILLMVDISASQNFGSGEKTKRRLAAELSACLALLAMMQQNNVGLLLFSDRVEAYLPPKKSRAHAWKLIRSVLDSKASGQGTDLSVAMEFALKNLKRNAVCILISDFWASLDRKKLRELSRRHDLLAIMTRDPHEENLPHAGIVRVQDLESGQVLSLHSSHPRVIEALRQQQEAQSLSLHQTLAQAGIRHITIRSGDSLAGSLFELFHQPRQKGGFRR